MPHKHIVRYWFHTVFFLEAPFPFLLCLSEIFFQEIDHTEAFPDFSDQMWVIHSQNTCVLFHWVLCVCVLSHFSRVQLFVTLWTVARQSPLSMGFFRQEHSSGYHALLQGIFLIQGLKPHFMSHALAGGFFTNSTTREAPCYSTNCHLFSCRRSEQVLPRCAPLVCGFFWAKDKGDPMGSRETAVPPFTT